MNLKGNIIDIFNELNIQIYEVKENLYVLNDNSLNIDVEKSKYDGLILYQKELAFKPKRAEMAKITRDYNRASYGNPVLVFFKYGNKISFALSERTQYKQNWRHGEKAGKVIILRDIDIEKTHTGHIKILQNLKNINVQSFHDLHNAWLKILDIKVLSKEFYKRLEDWYQKCDIQIDLTKAAKILNKSIDDELKPQAIIRVIMRLMFIWFMKEKGLINPVFFTRAFASEYLDGENTYYNAILQNLFFAALNKRIDERRYRKHTPQQDPSKPPDPTKNDYGISDLFRFNYCFRKGKANEFLEKTKTIPYINGGLFTCHDYKFAGEDIEKKKNTHQNYIVDGFSDNPKDRAKISDNVIFLLIDIFNDFVWTIEEATPLEQDIALDPELLGTIFENLIASYNPETKENARKATGSFYTPREIVEYMCKESLKETLKSRFTGLNDEIDALIEYNEDYLDFPDNKEMQSAITHLRIIDPACGSGAFCMGMFTLMVRTIEKLQDKKTTYKNKLAIIKNCIYGVDIQNIAVEITKLRFFISLLVDYDPPEKIEEFDVLPNLETKFVVANTLIDIDLKNASNLLIDLEKEFKELTNIFTPFMTATTPSAKIEIKNRFNKKKEEIINNPNFEYGEDIKEHIRNWNPFNVCYCSPFFNSLIMFGLDGFDIVIGNPPYIQLQKEGGKLANLYTSYKYKAFDRMGDIYCLFYERGIQLLRENATLCYITSNKWMRAGYGEKLRDVLSNKNPKLLIDLGGDVFENATVDTNILLLQNAPNQGNTISHIVGNACMRSEAVENADLPDFNSTNINGTHTCVPYGLSGLENMSDLIRHNGVSINFSKNAWVILNPIEQEIKRKIEAIGTPLKDWDISINYGIKTGCNDAFIIDKNTKTELIRKDPKSAEIIRPILRGKDIKRYGYEFAEKWLITTHNGYEGVPPVDVNKYPAVKEHLDKFWEQIVIRDDQGHTPYNLRSCKYMEDFYKQKIVYSEIVREPQFYLDIDGDFYPEATAFIMTGEHLVFLYHALHSKPITYFFRSFYAGGGLGEEGYRYKKKFLENLPIPKPCNLIEEEIEKLSQQKDYNDIDLLIYRLYNLSDAEINFIESQ